MFAIVKHLDVIKDFFSGLISRFIGSASNSFPLEQLKEAFSYRIVVAVSSAAHAAHQPVCVQKVLPLFAGELAALVRMHNHLLLWFASPNRHQQGIDNQRSVNSRTHEPAHNLHCEQINHYSQIQTALMGANVSDVGDPGLIGLGHCEFCSRRFGAACATAPERM